MRNMRSILSRYASFHLRGEVFGNVHCFFCWVKHFLQFNGALFQTKASCASLKGVSHSFQRVGATFKYKGQMRQVSFW